MDTTLPPRRTIGTPLGTLSYREAGAGPALVLLHGMNGSAASWVQQFEALAGSHRVIGWDAPGYGASDVVEPTADAFAAAVLALATALGEPRFALLGHSQGGVVAARTAGLEPARITRLILSSTFPGRARPLSEPLSERYAGRLRDLEQLSRSDYGRRRAESMTAPDAAPAVLDILAGIAAEMRPEGLRAASLMTFHADNRPFLPRISAPTLVLTATRDTVVPAALAQPFLDLIPCVTSAQIDGAGHAAYLEAPEAYNAVLLGFLGEA